MKALKCITLGAIYSVQVKMKNLKEGIIIGMGRRQDRAGWMDVAMVITLESY